MKKFVLFIALSGFALSACHAQISIGLPDMPNAGDTLRVSNTLSTIDPTATGANYTWNYAHLIPASQWVNKFDKPASFTPPFNLVFNALNTSYGLEQNTPDSISGTGLSVGKAYGFLKKSSADLRQIGYGLTLNSIPVPFSYSPPDFIFRFPLTYGDKDSCDSKFMPSIPIGYYYGQNIHRVNTADGWGTLITPYGTFSCLRVKSMITVRDTFANASGVGFAFARPLQYEYKWLTLGGKIPYLQVNATQVGGIPVVTRVSYRDSVRTGSIFAGVNDFSAPDFGLQVFPNPANEYLLVQYTLDNTADIKIELCDISGQKISTLKDSRQGQGTHMEIIRLQNLSVSSGNYFVCLYAGTRREVRKIAVVK